MSTWETILTTAVTCFITLLVTFIFNWVVNRPAKKKKEKEIEKQLFSNINPNQMKEKKYQLKKDYMDLYETILRLLDDLNKIPRNSNTQTVLDFLNKKTTELKDLVSYNILHNYDNKTYIENTLTYQECLAALNSIGTILKELGADLESKEDDDEEKDPVDY